MYAPPLERQTRGDMPGAAQVVLAPGAGLHGLEAATGEVVGWGRYWWSSQGRRRRHRRRAGSSRAVAGPPVTQAQCKWGAQPALRSRQVWGPPALAG